MTPPRRHRSPDLGRLAALVFATLVVGCTDESNPSTGGNAMGGNAMGGSDGGLETGGRHEGAASNAGGGGAGGGGVGGIAIGVFEPGEDSPGGETTTHTRDASSFLRAAENLSPERRGTFEAGFALFDVPWTHGGSADRDGLGPTYVGTSCQSCHFRGGRGAPPPAGQPMTSMLVRLSVPLERGGLGPDPRYGDQLQNRAVPGVTPEGWFSVSFESTQSAFDDGEPFELLTPSFQANALGYGPLPDGTRLSARVAQPMIGLGLLAAIAEGDLEALEDPDDVDGDGVRGRLHLHDGPEGPTIGRYGWKANQTDLAQQTASAFLGDMGITSPLRPTDDCPPLQVECAANASAELDIDPARFDAVVFFSHLVAVPHRPNAQDPDVLRGKGVFQAVGCATCHVPSFRTGPLPGYPELEDQLIFPYTDLLLHDMGAGLADERPDGDASGRDFRTPPLWGIGVVDDVSGHARLLHDGRARSIEEAILWHGGEAQGARDAFTHLSGADRRALLDFVDSL